MDVVEVLDYIFDLVGDVVGVADWSHGGRVEDPAVGQLLGVEGNDLLRLSESDYLARAASRSSRGLANAVGS